MVESVAENTSDAVVAPLLAGAVGGVAGIAAYRAANTLDAMVGHRSARYRNFGWASARLDDVLNLVPARLSALLATALAPIVGGSRTDALRTWNRDAHRHPSPNAGPVEAAFAGALDVQLGGTNVYGDRVEHRPTLGTGPAAQRDDIDAFRTPRGCRRRCRPRGQRGCRAATQAAAAAGSLTSSTSAGTADRRTITTWMPRSLATCILDQV